MILIIKNAHQKKVVPWTLTLVKVGKKWKVKVFLFLAKTAEHDLKIFFPNFSQS